MAAPKRGRGKTLGLQLEMLNKAGTAVRDPRGGRRDGAGRKAAQGRRPSEPHRVRRPIKASEPQHVVMRAVRVVGSLRGFAVYQALRRATVVAARREDVRIVHMSIQDTHVHMIVEATDRQALARGMQGFQISAAKWINRAITKETGKTRKGQVFADRYFAESITCPRYARRAIAYVLNNWRKHREDGRLESCRWLVDPFSSGGLFDGWQDLADRGLARWTLRHDYVPLTVREPQTWLLRVGWKQHGLIRCHEVPSTIR